MPRDTAVARKPRQGGSVACACLTCGHVFGIVPAKAAMGDGKYCSLECFHASVGYRRQVRAALPGTFDLVAARSGVAPETVRDQLFGLVRRGEAHVSKLVDVTGERGLGTPARALWFELGPGGDPDMPLTARAALAHMTRRELLQAMPGTQTELVKRTGQKQGSVSRILAEMHADGCCYVKRWRRPKTGPAVPVYAAGDGVDAVCRIVRMTQAERSARYLAKAKRTGRIEVIRARDAAHQRTKTLLKRGDPLVRALFGGGQKT